MVMLLATDAILEQAVEARPRITRSPFSSVVRRIVIATSLLLFRSVVLTGRGVAFTGRATAGVFASSFDAAVTGAGAKDADGRPVNVWPPRQF